MLFLFIGINSYQFCNPLSNVDFVHLWDNYRRSNFKKYAITLHPTTPSLPQMLYLQYYRTESDGWKDYGNCDGCVQENIRNLRSLSNCRQSDICCSCNICKRQPPSLVHLATHVLLNYTSLVPEVLVIEFGIDNTNCKQLILNVLEHVKQKEIYKLW